MITSNLKVSLHESSGKPKFSLYKDVTWTDVLKSIQEYLPDYIRTVFEPAKDKLMADRFLPEVKKLMPALGLTVEQDETFFINLKN